MLKLKTLLNSDLDIEGKTILYRAPYDIETIWMNGKFVLADDLRIKATIPTLKYLLEKKCKIVILTYVGRPDGKIVESLRTNPHAEKLSELLGLKVLKLDDCVGKEVEQSIYEMKSGEIIMLENVRFHPEEISAEENFSKELCLLKDIIVYDGFPQAHRKHASTTGIEKFLPSVAGFYLEKEVYSLSSLLESPKRPFTVIIGGAKISDKVDAIGNLFSVADNFLVGGAVANVFLKAIGREMGSSFMEDVFVDSAKRIEVDWKDEAKKIYDKALILNKKLILPEDLIISNGIQIKEISNENIPIGWMALDIGTKTRKTFSEIIRNSKTIFMNGPMGKFEKEEFCKGTIDVLNSVVELKKNGGNVIIGGGETIETAKKYTSLEDYSHISLAGGATSEFLAGKELPALVPLIIK